MHQAMYGQRTVTLDNTQIAAIATPGHALAHHAYLVTDHTHSDVPRLVLTGDALLVGDAGRPDLHAHGDHSTAVLSFIVAFGVAKALTNLAAGALAERGGRRRPLVAGWVVALPLLLLIAVAPSWGWIVAANGLLGVTQGLAWS